LISKKRRLYKIEISEDIMYYSETSFLAQRNNVPFGKPRKGVIKKGITGVIINKWGKKYFSPDVNQPGIEDFTPPGQPYILIPYNKVENLYKVID
jgi:hypothetical protein